MGAVHRKQTSVVLITLLLFDGSAA